LALLPLQASPRLMASLSVGAPTGASVTPGAITYLLLLGVVGSGVSTMAYIWLVLKRGPLFAGMTTYVVPVIALLWGTLDHEAISSMQAMAIAGVLGMVALVQTKGAGDVAADAKPQAARLDFGDAGEGELVTLPMAEIALTDRCTVQAESQVA
jgi:drug/metabolite transporter (DMT)-like permease